MTTSPAASNAAHMQTASATVGNLDVSIRWVKVGEDVWLHAPDLLVAMSYKNGAPLNRIPGELRDATQVYPDAPPGKFVTKAGVEELFKRRRGGNTAAVHDFIRARIYEEEDVDCDNASEVTEAEPPPISWAELTALEHATQVRAQTTLYHSQALEARSRVLDAYAAGGGDVDHPDYVTARAALFAEMRRPYQSDYIDVREYLLLIGYSEEAANSIAPTLGADIKRVYQQERNCPPLTYSAMFAGHASNVCVYHRYKDMELLGSCWRQFVKARDSYKQQYHVSEQRKQDQRRLRLMQFEPDGSRARGYGPARTAAPLSLAAPY